MIVSMYDVKSYACEVAVVEESETAGDYIEPRSIIEWRYKLVDGVLYRRKYNYTEECWGWRLGSSSNGRSIIR